MKRSRPKTKEVPTLAGRYQRAARAGFGSRGCALPTPVVEVIEEREVMGVVDLPVAFEIGAAHGAPPGGAPTPPLGPVQVIQQPVEGSPGGVAPVLGALANGSQITVLPVLGASAPTGDRRR